MLISSLNIQNDYSFKGTIDYKKIYKEMENLSVKQDEIILTKTEQKIKNLNKTSYFAKISNKIKDILFKMGTMTPIDTEFKQDTYKKIYHNGAYKEFRVIKTKIEGDILLKKKEKTPSGIERIYSDFVDESFLISEKLPNGTIKDYKIVFGRFRTFSKLYKITQPNGKVFYK